MTCELYLKESKPSHINAFNKTLEWLSVPFIISPSLQTSLSALPCSLRPSHTGFDGLFLLQDAPSPPHTSG